MILVRFVFQAKFGQAGKVAEDFKGEMETMKRLAGREVHGRILTDLSGSFDTVVQEFELESLAEWEQLRQRSPSPATFSQLLRIRYY